MKKHLLIAMCALSLCCAGLAQTQTPAFTPLSADDMPLLEENSARISLNTSKTKYEGGEYIKLDIILKNVGTKGFRIFPTDPHTFYEVEVIGPDSKKVLPLAASRQRSEVGETWGIAPNGSKTATLWISNLFDMTAWGTYKITASKKFHLGRDIITIKSEPLLVDVTSVPTTSEWK